MRRWLAVVLGLIGSLVVAAPAQADSYTTYQYCHREYDTMNFAYHYAPGNYDVYAGEWHDHQPERLTAPVQPDPCVDINVEIASTGGFVVRTVVCPDGQACYALAWGSLNQFTTFGVTAHSYHLPCGGTCDFLWRVETTTSETLRVGF